MRREPAKGSNRIYVVSAANFYAREVVGSQQLLQSTAAAMSLPHAACRMVVQSSNADRMVKRCRQVTEHPHPRDAVKSR